MHRKIKVFISYSHKDERACIEFHNHIAPLKESGMIEAWYDVDILPGEDIYQKISASIDKTDIWCLLVSGNFIRSTSCMAEKKIAFALAKENRLMVVPIILSPCEWHSDPDISGIKLLPKDGRPLSSFRKDKEEAWQNIIQELKSVIGKIESIHATETDENRKPTRPYKYLNPFESGDTSIFFGRDREISELTSKIRQYRITLLYAKSGTGKTSLINAGLIPQLRQISKTESKNYRFLQIRSLENPLLELKSKICTMIVSHPSNYLSVKRPLKDLLTEFQSVNDDQILLIILDQFEEFFIRIHPTIQEVFLHEFTSCFSDETHSVKWLVSLREDYLGEIAEINKAFNNRMNLFSNYVRLKKFNKDQAIEAIRRPAEIFSIKFENDLIERIIQDLILEDTMETDQGKTDNLIDPPHIQIICEHLYNRMITMEITSQIYENSGGVKTILSDYLNLIINQNYVSDNQRTMVKELFKEFITPENTKRFRTIANIRNSPWFYYKYTEKEIQAQISKLCDLRLLREYHTLDEKGYELTHEYLTTSIVNWIGQEESSIRLAGNILEKELSNFNYLKKFDTGLETFQFIDNHRNYLVFPEREAAYMLCISLKLNKYQLAYWLHANRKNHVAIDSLFLLLESVKGSSITVDNLRRDILIVLCQLPISGNQEEKLLALSLQVGNPSVISQLEMLEKQQFINNQSFIRQIKNKTAERFWKEEVKMVRVSAGNFIFGSSDQEKEDRLGSLIPNVETWQKMIRSERNQGTVYLDEFWIDKYAVTNKEFAEFDEMHQYEESKQNWPATNITWERASAYCQWLGKRLPAEEEWEKAARGCDGFLYPWGNNWQPEKSNTLESGNKREGVQNYVDVNLFPDGKSPFGCFNMAGNIWEWTSTDYEVEPGHKIAKGGSCSTGGRSLACCCSRYKFPASQVQVVIGFRAASSVNVYEKINE